jgi:probable HAF family extracellular repeat protein
MSEKRRLHSKRTIIAVKVWKYVIQSVEIGRVERAKGVFMFLRRIPYSVFIGFLFADFLFISFLTAFSLGSIFPRRANAASALPPPPVFTIQDLGTLPFIADDVLPGLSDTGKVCFWQNRQEAVAGTVWSHGQGQDLGSIAGYPSTIPHAINAGGEIAGWASTSANSVDSRAVTRACVWRSSVLTLLGTLGGRNSQAFGINSQNIVVGVAQCVNGARHAFLAKNDSLRDLGTLPGGTFSQAYAINAAGQIVGVSNSSLPYKHAVSWREGQVHDLGLLPGGTTSSAQAINSLGQIAGYADTPDGTHAFLYTQGKNTQGKMLDLGTLGEAPSNAAALNDQGQVVGTSGFAPDQDHAFLWQKGAMLDLNKLIAPSAPWVLLRACAINSHGQIVCVGHRKNDQTAHLLFLTLVLAHAN